MAALCKVCPTDLGVRGGRDNQATGVVLDTGQPGAVVHAHPMDVLASGTHRDVDVLLSMASDDMGWWVTNDLDRFDPHTLDRITDEVAGWHGTEMYALVGQEQPGRGADQAERDTRIRDIVLDFVTGEQTRLWPAVTNQPTSGSVGTAPFEPDTHYQAALDLWEDIDRP